MEGMPTIGKINTSRQFHQLGIFVLDGSGSMSSQSQNLVSKADAVNIAVRDLLTRFKVSRVKKNFSFAVVPFDTSASLRLATTAADMVDDNGDYNPMINHGGGTYIYEGLLMAEKLANDFLNQAPVGGVPHSAIILLMTDGGCANPSQTLQIANRIKNEGKQITICTTFFGEVGHTDNTAKELLRDIANDRVMGFKEVYDSETLRTFFEKSISAASGGIQID